MIEQLVKKYLYQTVGIKEYLKVLYKTQSVAFDTHGLKNVEKYEFAYFLPKIIQEGAVVIEIGANIGYHTRILQRLVGDNGKVYAIEPIKIYADTIKWALGHHNNVLVYQCALGNKESTLTQHLKIIDGVIRPKNSIIKSADVNDDSLEIAYTSEAKMLRPSMLFRDINHVDLIRIDANEHGADILQDMEDIIRKSLPIIQVSTSGEYFQQTCSVLYKYGYHKYKLQEGKLHSLDLYEVYPFDYLFIPFTKQEKYLHLMSKKESSITNE